MSDVNLPGLIIPIEARVSQLEKSMKRAAQVQNRAAQQMEQRARQSADRMAASYGSGASTIAASFNKLKGLALPLAGGFLGGLAAGGVSAVAGNLRRVTTEIANIGNEARRAGVAVEDFQAWGYVAQQNRISLDALTDGFKELNLRADEFITTGKGSAADAFTRLGFRADDLARRLSDPSELMLEILGRLQHLDRAAQIRIADEIFGGTGGERFVELLDQGQGAIRATLDQARETGAVLDAELIAKADELDKKFTALATSVGNFGKRAAVAISEAVVELVDFRDRLDKIFPDEAQGRAILGDALYDALDRDRDTLDENAEAAQRLRGAYALLGQEAGTTSNALAGAVPQLNAWGYEEQARTIASVAAEMRELAGDFADGEVSAEDFTERMVALERKAAEAFGTLEDGDRVEFGGVISQLTRLAGVIGTVTELARTFLGVLQQATGLAPDQQASAALRQRHAAEAESIRNYEAMTEANQRFAASETARNAATSEQLRLQREVEAVKRRAGEAGATLTAQQAEASARASIAAEDARRAADRAGRGAGGGGEKLDDFGRAAQSIRDRTLALQAEAAALVAAASAGDRYSATIDYARARAQLMNEAQSAGRDLTPQLQAEIDTLARSFVTAGLEAEAAADRLRSIEDAGRGAAETLTEMFSGILSGSMTAQDALKNLLLKLAEVQFQRAMMGMFSGAAPTSFLGKLGGLLGYADGGFTGQGGKYEPAGIVHKGEFVMSKAATERIGVGNLDRLHQSALRGYSGGGLVSDAPRQMVEALRPANSDSRTTSISINAPVTVNATGGSPEQNADLARQVSEQTERAIRGIVQHELVRQMRPGGILR